MSVLASAIPILQENFPLMIAAMYARTAYRLPHAACHILQLSLLKRPAPPRPTLPFRARFPLARPLARPLPFAFFANEVVVHARSLPEYLFVSYIAPTSLAWRAAFAVISPLLNGETRKLLKMIASCEELSKRCIDPSQLPIRMGGLDDWEFDPARDLRP